jgi:hypothetical protein
MIARSTPVGTSKAELCRVTTSALVVLLAASMLLLASPTPARAKASGLPVDTAVPVVKGSAKVGKKLKATKGKWSGSATITYGYQWQACDGLGENCLNISAATGSSYTPNATQVGSTLRVVVTATNRFGKASAASLVTSPIAPVSGVGRINLCGSISKSVTMTRASIGPYVITCSITVPGGVTVTATPGTVIKAQNDVGLVVKGTLVAQGTAESPVTFTSINDDTVGGATGSGTPQAGDWNGIYVEAAAGQTPPSLDLEHVRARFAGVQVFGAAITTVRDSTLSDGRGLEVEAPGASVAVTVTNNVIERSSGDGIRMYTNGSSPTVAGNTIREASDYAVSVNGNMLDPSLLTGNTGSDNKVEGIGLSGTVVSDLSLPLGGLPLIVGDGYWSGSLKIAAGVTMTVPAGTVVKANGTCCGPGNMGPGGLQVEGSLVAQGTAESPVTFTSINDDTVGGATGSGTPQAGDWNGIYVSGKGSSELAATNIAWAATGFNFAGGNANLSAVTVENSTVGLNVGIGGVAFRGRLVSDAYGIRACDWSQTTPCLVDAAYSYWGSPAGPSETNVCGAVTTYDYYEASDRSGNPVEPSFEGTINCDKSATPWEEYSESYAQANGSYTSENGTCILGDANACATVKQYLQCFNAAVTLASSQTGVPITVTGVTSNVISSVGSAAQASENPNIASAGQAGGTVAGLLSDFSTIAQIRNSYDTCF